MITEFVGSCSECEGDEKLIITFWTNDAPLHQLLHQLCEDCIVYCLEKERKDGQEGSNR